MNSYHYTAGELSEKLAGHVVQLTKPIIGCKSGEPVGFRREWGGDLVAIWSPWSPPVKGTLIDIQGHDATGHPIHETIQTLDDSARTISRGYAGTTPRDWSPGVLLVIIGTPYASNDDLGMDYGWVNQPEEEEVLWS